MKISVINPPYFKMYSRCSRSPAVTKSRTLYYPYWLAYAVGVLEKSGHEVQFIDSPAMNLDKQETINKVAEFKPNLVVVDSTTASFYSDSEILSAIKKYTGAVCIMVGTHVSALPEDSLTYCIEIDAIARNEYDYILDEVAKKIENSENYKEVLGLSYIHENKIINNPNMPFIENLDDLPFVSSVYKKHLKDCYKEYFYGANLHPLMVLLSGRGCPYKCVYCVYPQVMTGHKYRKRSASNIVNEFEYIKLNFPEVKEVFIEDDTLTIDRKRVKQLCEEIKKRNLKITWSANSRFDVDYETLKIMKESGCRELCVGFESGDQDVLNNIGKKVKVEQAYSFMKNAKKLGLIIHGCFLVGNPGETKETLKKTLDYALKLNPDTAQFYPIMVYPGTRAYDWADENGFLKTKKFDEWLTSEGLHNSVVNRSNLTHSDLVCWANDARRKFYIRPSYILSKIKQIFLHPSESKRIFLAAGTLFSYLFKKNNTVS